MNEPCNVLLIGGPLACEAELRGSGHTITHAATYSEGVQQLARGKFEAVLVDLSLLGSRDLESLCKTSEPVEIPVVVLADRAIQKAVFQVLSLGAQDYLIKEDVTAAVFIKAVQSAIHRHRATQASSGHSNLLRLLMEHIPDSIYFKDINSRFIMMSKAQSRNFGLTDPSEAVGKTDADFFSETHAKQALADEQQIIKTGRPIVGLEEMETWPDGSVTWVSTTKMPLRDPAGRIIGTFGISRNITKRKIAEQALSERTRQLEQRNEQIAGELRMARELQMAMLPREFPSVANGSSGRESALEFFSFYYPTGAVSGDFFDVVPLSNTSVGVFICDVMGHDVRAALVTAMMRALVQDLSSTATMPGELLAQINSGLVGIFKQSGATMFATAFYLVADVANGELRYSSAAHPDPMHLRRRTGEVGRLDSDPGHKKGPALGLFENAVFPTWSRKMETGDLIALFTDGLIEAESPDQRNFTHEELTAALRRRAHSPVTQMLDGLISDIQNFSGKPGFDDDICLVGMEVKWLAQPPVPSGV